MCPTYMYKVCVPTCVYVCECVCEREFCKVCDIWSILCVFSILAVSDNFRIVFWAIRKPDIIFILQLTTTAVDLIKILKNLNTEFYTVVQNIRTI